MRPSGAFDNCRGNMRLSLAKEHRDFFQKNGHIEFSSLLSQAQVLDFANAVDATLLKRQKTTRPSTEREHNLEHDLWRDHPQIKKVSLNRDFAEVAAELTKQDKVRIAYDQNISPRTGKDSYLPTGMTSLEQMSCIKPIILGLLVRLSEGRQPTLEKLPCPCPSSPGDGVFFSSQLLLSWDPLLAMQSEHFFLIAYTNAHPLYVLEKRDPCTHALKQQGYGFGDTLKSDTHPLLYSL
jgi:hypothetical protein